MPSRAVERAGSGLQRGCGIFWGHHGNSGAFFSLFFSALLCCPCLALHRSDYFPPAVQSAVLCAVCECVCVIEREGWGMRKSERLKESVCVCEKHRESVCV